MSDYTPQVDTYDDDENNYKDYECEYNTFRVRIQGDTKKEPLILLSELGVSTKQCYDQFLNHDETQFMRDIFCFYHVDFVKLLPGAQQVDYYTEEMFSIDHFVQDFHELLLKQEVSMDRIHLMGAGFGGYLLTSYALVFPKKIASMMLVSSNLRSCSWKEYIRIGTENYKLANSNMEGTITEFMSKYFSPKFLSCEAYCIDYIEHFKQIPPYNLLKVIQTYIRRKDLAPELKLLPFPVLMFVGFDSPHVREIMETISSFHSERIAYYRVPNCGGLTTIENPSEMIVSMKLFLQGMNYLLDERVDVQNHLHLRTRKLV
jgi:pimeloyl-ACP methyl ester carboxylesterase